MENLDIRGDAQFNPMLPQYQVFEPPSDGITKVEFAPGSERLLLVSSWDMSVNLYDVEGNKKLVTYRHECPVLDVCFLQNEEYCCSVGSDGHIILKNISVERRFPLQPIGKHVLGARKCIFNRDKNMLMTGSWDTTVKVFDPRQGPESHSKGRLECSELRSIQHSGKIFSMCNGKLKIQPGKKSIQLS